MRHERAWRLGEEEFIKDLNIFSDLKFRIGYGLAGNNRIGSYSSLAIMSSVTYPNANSAQSGYASKQVPNPDLKWEANKTFNIAVQNLFLKLWLKKEEIDETKPINRYLFTMLKNDLLNTLRDSKKNIYLLEDCLSMVLELEDNSQNENLKQEQMNIIQQALEQLSPQRRKVFEMKVSGKYSNQEIADKLNLSINTIKFQYSQSLKQIRATVGELSLLLLYCMM